MNFVTWKKKKDKFEIRIYGTSEIHICVMLSFFCVCVCGIDIFFPFFCQHKYKTVLKKYPHLTIYEKKKPKESFTLPLFLGVKEKSDLLGWFQSGFWVG